MARSRRACPEHSRGNPGDACWQMLFRAFQPQTTGQIKKVTSSGEAEGSAVPRTTTGNADSTPQEIGVWATRGFVAGAKLVTSHFRRRE
jgi:hypothetical protein